MKTPHQTDYTRISLTHYVSGYLGRIWSMALRLENILASLVRGLHLLNHACFGCNVIVAPLLPPPFTDYMSFLKVLII